MTVSQQAYQEALYQMFLSNDGLVHAHAQGVNKRTLALNTLLKFANVNRITHFLYYFYIILIYGAENALSRVIINKKYAIRRIISNNLMKM